MSNGIENRQKLTVIIPSYNEENNIERCLKSVSWADEILLVDSFSTDRTLEIAQQYTNRILQHKYHNSAAQKNWTIPQADHDWVLLVDCDETVSIPLGAEIRRLLRQDPPEDGYWIFRNNYLMGKRVRYSGWGRDSVLRLFRKDQGRYDEKRVHAEIKLKKTGTLKARLEHNSIASIAAWVNKINRYSSWKAEDKHENQVRAPVFHLLFRPPLRFIKDFIFRLGFLDGWRGFLIASMSAFAELIMAAKLTWRTYQRRGRD
ncbi:MAG: glycosyltransferase family 2 protein [bacterium]|nr:glycosyltransferase family 2 protein [bacterium]